MHKEKKAHLSLINISKNYSTKKMFKTAYSVQALDSVTLSLTPGFYGLLGPNGAGKTTLFNILSGNLTPDKGKVLWNGINIDKLRIKYYATLGFTPQQQGLYDNLTGRDFLTYFCTLKGVSREQMSNEIDRVSEIVNLEPHLKKKIVQFSGGMKQRILVAQALLGDPQLLLLDEPSAGLDPSERVRLRESLKQLSNNRIIIVATHVVQDIEEVSDSIILLKEGKLIDFGAPKKLVGKYSPNGTIEDVYLKIFGKG